MALFGSTKGPMEAISAAMGAALAGMGSLFKMNKQELATMVDPGHFAGVNQHFNTMVKVDGDAITFTLVPKDAVGQNTHDTFNKAVQNSPNIMVGPNAQPPSEPLPVTQSSTVAPVGTSAPLGTSAPENDTETVPAVTDTGNDTGSGSGSGFGSESGSSGSNKPPGGGSNKKRTKRKHRGLKHRGLKRRSCKCNH